MNHRVVFTDVCKVEVQAAEMPTPGPNQMLVRTSKTAISTGTELTMLMSDFPEGSKWDKMTHYPTGAGYSHVGEVVEIGEQVRGFEVGDRVASGASHAAWAVLEPAQAFRIPDAVTDEVATLWMLGRIAFNGMRRGGLQMGESVVVYGLGIIGQFVCQLARLDGARPVIGVDVAPLRLDLARKLGGTDLVIDGAAGDILDRVSTATRGRMADCVFEVTGVADLIPREMDLLRRQGRIVILSSPRGKTEFDFHDYCNSPSLTIIGAHNGSHPQFETPYNPWTPHRNVELLFDLIAGGEVRLAELITHRFHWQDAPAAYEMLMADRGEAGAVVLDWEE
ncbi:MAG TPA: zinc-binding dehydrogenase [Armatimonadota bacterium]|nr:zinc-binding dehydrogenase [Armatimonadota bacterium]